MPPKSATKQDKAKDKNESDTARTNSKRRNSKTKKAPKGGKDKKKGDKGGKKGGKGGKKGGKKGEPKTSASATPVPSRSSQSNLSRRPSIDSDIDDNEEALFAQPAPGAARSGAGDVFGDEPVSLGETAKGATFVQAGNFNLFPDRLTRTSFMRNSKGALVTAPGVAAAPSHSAPTVAAAPPAAPPVAAPTPEPAPAKAKKEKSDKGKGKDKPAKKGSKDKAGKKGSSSKEKGKKGGTPKKGDKKGDKKEDKKKKGSEGKGDKKGKKGSKGGSAKKKGSKSGSSKGDSKKGKKGDSKKDKAGKKEGDGKKEPVKKTDAAEYKEVVQDVEQQRLNASGAPKGVVIGPEGTKETRRFSTPGGAPVEVNTEVRRGSHKYIDDDGKEYEPFEVIQIRKSTRTYINEQDPEPIEETEIRKSTKKYVNPAGSQLFETQLKKSTRKSNRGGSQAREKLRGSGDVPGASQTSLVAAGAATPKSPKGDKKGGKEGAAAGKGKKGSKGGKGKKGGSGSKDKKGEKGSKSKKGSTSGDKKGKKGSKSKKGDGKKGNKGGSDTEKTEPKAKKEAGEPKEAKAKGDKKKSAGGASRKSSKASGKSGKKEKPPGFWARLFGKKQKPAPKAKGKGSTAKKGGSKEKGKKSAKTSRAPSAAAASQKPSVGPSGATPVVAASVVPVPAAQPKPPQGKPAEKLSPESHSLQTKSTSAPLLDSMPVSTEPSASSFPLSTAPSQASIQLREAPMVCVPRPRPSMEHAQQTDYLEVPREQQTDAREERPVITHDPYTLRNPEQVCDLHHRIRMKLTEIQNIRNEVCQLQQEAEQAHDILEEKTCCFNELGAKHSKLNNALAREFTRERAVTQELEENEATLKKVKEEEQTEDQRKPFDNRDRHMYHMQGVAHEEFNAMEGYSEIHGALLFDKIQTLKVWHEVAQTYLEDTACMRDSQQKAKQAYTAATTKYKRLKTARDSLSSEFVNLQEESERELQQATIEDQAERQEDQLMVAKYKDHLQRCLINRDLKYETVLEAKDYLVSSVKEQIQNLYLQHIALDAAGMDAVKTMDELLVLGATKTFSHESIKLLASLPTENDYVEHLEKIQKLLAEYIVCMKEIDVRREELLKQRADLLGVAGYGLLPADEDPDDLINSPCACPCPAE